MRVEPGTKMPNLQLNRETQVIMPSPDTLSEVFATGTDTLVRYVEVWLPNEDATRLNLQSSQLVGPERTRPSHNVTSVASGEGLAGGAWEQKSATILQEHPSELLKTISDQCGAKITAVMAIPVFCQQAIKGVVVLGFGDGDGAAEIWTRDDRDELAVSVSYYAGLPSFEFISRYTRFPKGAGVPGQVWKTAEPHLLQNLGQSDSFIRSFGNDPAEISAVVGIPTGNVGGFPASVVLLLSAKATPLANMTELWNCETNTGDSGSELVVTRTIGVRGEPQDFTAEDTHESWRKSVLRIVDDSKVPALLTSDDVELPAGATCILTLPVFRQAEITGVLNLLF